MCNNCNNGGQWNEDYICKGTNDYLPNEVEIRDYLQNEILKVYVENGFEHITTPVIEDIENLDKSDGGETLILYLRL